jgi:uncharacterized protein YciI
LSPLFRHHYSSPVLVTSKEDSQCTGSSNAARSPVPTPCAWRRSTPTDISSTATRKSPGIPDRCSPTTTRTPSAACAYINADPYTKAGIFESITVERWKPGLDVRQRAYARKNGTMQFVIHCRDKPDGGARRAQHTATHLDYLSDHQDIIVTRGPLLDDDGAKTIGSVLILDVADKAEAEAFWAGEPFNRAGVYERTTIERWRFGHV